MMTPEELQSTYDACCAAEVGWLGAYCQPRMNVDGSSGRFIFAELERVRHMAGEIVRIAQ